MPRIGIRITNDLNEELKTVAEFEGVSVSDFVRQSLEQTLQFSRTGGHTASYNVEHHREVKQLHEQTEQKDKQIQELHQLLAVAQKNVASVTEQNQLLLTDNRKQLWWERLWSRR